MLALELGIFSLEPRKAVLDNTVWQAWHDEHASVQKTPPLRFPAKHM